jgi:predicted PurR-regulated permease PerM
MLFAAFVAAVCLYIPVKALDQLVFDTTKTVNLIILTGIASFFGLAVYLLLVWFLKVQELETFGNLIKKIYRMKWSSRSGNVISEADPTSTI